MKHAALIFIATVFLSLAGGGALAQKPLYKCDNNHYTDSLTDPKAVGCKPLEGGNVTVVQGTKAPATTAPVRVATAPQAAGPASGQPGQRIEAGEQRARDSDARQILEAELKKAEARKAELAQDYNNGDPEKRGDEARNHQKYLDRVSEMKSGLTRIDGDIAGIRRELGRFGSN
jgi:hypothetical protein